MYQNIYLYILKKLFLLILYTYIKYINFSSDVRKSNFENFKENVRYQFIGISLNR